MNLSKRISQISPSVTLAITAKAKQMKAQGINVIGFGAGEPDFDTPSHIKNAAKIAIDAGFTKYTPASGTKELKEAVCKKFKIDNNLEYTPEEILISCGAKHSLYNAIVAICSEGDEVIIPSPYWVSYPEMVKASGAMPVILKATKKNNFKILPIQLREAITPKTKLFILNSPSNPTGMIYSKNELQEIAQILEEKGIYCISDEIYEKIIYDGQNHVSIASVNDKIKNFTIVINGVSKAYSMTGWRIGYAAGPKEIIKAMSNLQSHSTSNPTSIAQKAALAALEGTQEPIDIMVSEFKSRRDYIVERLNSIEGVSCIKTQGAFYVFPDVSKLFGMFFNGIEIKDSLSLTNLLLNEAKVAVIPGVAFGSDENLRLSYAISIDNIKEGLNQIDKFIKTI
ncbi:MAG: pyridoxal phosphate-dependent aminotransferase, partial [Candidatus Omnitrophica bacterium]|nr:pyridoxal phosphate-dependent aminotransferase [Candidatus Omnitrophota bacterium]